MKSLYKQIYPGDDETSENIKSGFRKSGIYPFHPDKVLERLPDYRKNEEEISVEETVSESFIEVLQELRGTKDERKVTRRKKIQVPAGKCIRAEDLQKENLEPHCIDSSSDNETDIDQEVEDGETYESDSREEIEEETSNKEVELIEGGFYVVEFKVRNHVKHYIGKILSILENENNVDITFLRMSRKVKNKFLWPDVEDTGLIPKKEIVRQLLSNPQMDRRNSFLFSERQLKPYLKTMG